MQALGAVLFAVVWQIKDFYFEKIDGKRDIRNLTSHGERLAAKDGWISTDGHKSYSRFGFEVRPDIIHLVCEHKYEFVEKNTGACTNAAEGAHSLLFRMAKAQLGSSTGRKGRCTDEHGVSAVYEFVVVAVSL